MASPDEAGAAKVCVLVLHDQFAHSPSLADLFHRCAEISVNTRNEHLLSSLSHGSENGLQYLVYEYPDLTPFYSMLTENPMPPVTETITLIETLLGVAHKIHSKIGGHGLISPATIFTEPDFKTVKLSGFRASELLRASLKKSDKSVSEMLAYLSPSVFRTSNPGPQEDIYSIGILLYRLLVGSLPWPNVQPADILKDGLESSFIPPSLKRLEIPDTLDEIVYDMMRPAKESEAGHLTGLLARLAEAKAKAEATAPLTQQFLRTEQELGRNLNLQETEDDTMEDRHGTADNKQPRKEEPVQQLFDELPADEDSAEPARVDSPDQESSENVSQPAVDAKDDSGAAAQDDEAQLTDMFASDASDSIETNEEETDRIVSEERGVLDEASLINPFGMVNPEEESPHTEEAPAQREEAQPADANMELTGSLQEDATEPSLDTTDFGKQEEIVAAGEDTENAGQPIPAEPPSPFETELHEGAQVIEETAQKELESGIPASDLREIASFPALESNEFEDRSTNSIARKTGLESPIAPANGDVQGGNHYGPGQTGEDHGGRNPYIVDIDGIEELTEDWAGQTSNKDLEYESNYPEIQTEPLLETDNLRTTETIDMRTSRVSVSTVWWVTKILLIALIPVAAIYFVITLLFDAGFENDGSQNGSQVAQSQDAGKMREPSSRPLLPSELKNDRPVIVQDSPPVDLSAQQTAAASQIPAKQPTENRPRRQTDRVSENRSSTAKLVPAATSATRRPPPRNRAAQRKPVPSPLLLDVLVRTGQKVQTADVYVDGKFHGRTNAGGILSIDNLQTGRSYLIKVQKAGFKMWATEAKFKQGGTRRLNVQLRPNQVANKVSSNTAGSTLIRGAETASKNPTPPAFEVSTASDPSQGLAATVNVLLSNTEPLGDAFIYVNDRLWDGFNYIAPAEIDLPAGSYEITIRKAGYRSTPPFYKFDVVAGDRKTVSFILTPE